MNRLSLNKKHDKEVEEENRDKKRVNGWGEGGDGVQKSQ